MSIRLSTSEWFSAFLQITGEPRTGNPMKTLIQLFSNVIKHQTRSWKCIILRWFIWIHLLLEDGKVAYSMKKMNNKLNFEGICINLWIVMRFFSNELKCWRILLLRFRILSKDNFWTSHVGWFEKFAFMTFWHSYNANDLQNWLGAQQFERAS